VAVKILHMARGADAPRAMREAMTLASLPLPGVVRYLGHGELPGTRYLVTEWIEGGTLADRLVSRGVSAAEGLAVTLRLAEILAPVHAAGVVHRDIKPSNVLSSTEASLTRGSSTSASPGGRRCTA
jgi:serine/threonine protein kinase